MGTENRVNRQSWIDSLKGMAICGVIMKHAGGAELPSFLGAIGNSGSNGVQLFFLLSAYLSFISFENNIAKNGNYVRSNIIWIIKKFIRLIPLYYLAILIYFVGAGGAKFWLGSEEHIRIGNLLAHITFTHGFFPHYADSIIGVEWYIGVLAILYVMVPCLYKWIDSLEKSIIWFLVSGFVSWGFSLAGGRFFVPKTADAYIYSSYFGTFSFVVQFPIIVLGITMYFLFKSSILDFIKDKKIFSYVLLIFSICMINGMVLGYNNLLGLSSFTLFGIWFFVLSISQKLHKCVIIDNILFQFLGKYSYPIYLFHYCLIWIYDKYVPTLTGNVVINWGVKYLVIIIVASIIAILLDKYFDKPIEKKLLFFSNKILDSK